jgi:hypothetical protein
MVVRSSRLRSTLQKLHNPQQLILISETIVGR